MHAFQIIIASFSLTAAAVCLKHGGEISLDGIFSHRDNNTIDTSAEYLFAIILAFLPPTLLSFSLGGKFRNSIYLLIYFTSILLRFAHIPNPEKIANAFPFFLSLSSTLHSACHYGVC